MSKNPVYDDSLKLSQLHPRYWLTWLSLGLLAILAWLPARFRDLLAGACVKLVIKLAKKQCHTARINLQLCFPQLSDQERDAILADSIAIGIKGFFALGEPTFLPPSMFLKRLHVNGHDALEKAKATGRPIIFMIPHTWTIDACGLYFSGAEKFNMCTMMHSARNPVYDWFLNKQRVRFGGKVYERSAGLKPIIKDLKGGYHFFYLPDQDHGHEASIFVPLFGVEKATLPALPKLAKLANAIVVPVLATYNQDLYRYELQIRPHLDPYPTTDLIKDVELMNHEIEVLLTKQPSQYMWFLKYFRSLPDGTNRKYGR